MTKRLMCMAILLMLGLSLVGAVSASLERADSFFWYDRLEEAKELLLETLERTTDRQQQVEVLWRLSRVTLSIGDERKEEGASDDELFAAFEEAEGWAHPRAGPHHTDR